VLAGGAGALCATALSHYVYLVVGDAVAALAGFALGYALAGRSEPPGASGLARVAGAPPQWVWLAGRLSVVLAALAFFLGDRALYSLGVQGLLRKCAAVVIATAVLAVGTRLSRWPR
jgi:hypothetical protein